MLKNELAMQDLIKNLDDNNDHGSLLDTQSKQKMAYADIVNKNDNRGKEKRNSLVKEKSAQWETPQTAKKHETMIQIENVNDPKEAITKLKC